MPKDQIPIKQFHTLTRAVGIGDEIVPDFWEEPLQEGDILLLCSDGLTDMISDEEIENILMIDSNDLDQTAGALIAAANDRGGQDNISVVLVRYEAVIPQAKEDQ